MISESFTPVLGLCLEKKKAQSLPSAVLDNPLARTLTTAAEMKENSTMKTKEIPKEEWPKFFDAFSRQHEGWLVTIEIFGTVDGLVGQEARPPLLGSKMVG